MHIWDSAIVAAATLLEPLYIADRFPARQGRRPRSTRPSGRVRMAVELKPEEMDEIDRRLVQLKIEREALLKGDRRLVSRRAWIRLEV